MGHDLRVAGVDHAALAHVFRVHLLDLHRVEGVAIGTHRAKRSAAIKKNPLDDVPGIGPRRKKALLMHFGSARSVSRASVADLLGVEGISETVAQKIYDHFHQE